MSDTVIRVENLAKKYVLGQQEEGSSYKTFRGAMTNAAKSLGNALNPRAKKEARATKGEFWALKDVSFEIKQGDRVGFIGRNGAGKSTLLKVLSRITEPTSGSIRIKGRVASLLEVGTGFHPELTGRENIFLNGAILGMSRVEIRRKFDEIVAFAEVEKFLDTPVKRYSSGMYVRLAFAVAAHLEPEILIVDEVLAVGDAKFQEKCLAKMSNIAQEGRTILFVSHNMGAIRSLCESIVWLKNGEVALSGSAKSVIDHYLKSTFQNTSLSVDLQQVKRSHGLGQSFQIRNFVINDGKPILHGEPLTIRFQYESFSEVGSVSVGIGFNSLEGSRIMTVDSDHSGHGEPLNARHNIPSGTQGTIVMELSQVFLQPGRYVIDVGARTGDYATVDAIPACLHVDVLPGPSTPGHLIRQKADGGVRQPAKWEWKNTLLERDEQGLLY